VKPGTLILLLLATTLLAGCAGLSDQTITVGPPPPYAPKEIVVPTRAMPDAAIHIGPGATRVAVGESAVWILQADRLLKIDPQSNQVQMIVSKIRSSSSIAAGEGAVWVSDRSRLLKLDPQTGRVLARLPVACDNVAVGAGSVWAANPGKGTVVRIDPRTGLTLATIEVDRTPMVLAAGEGAVWVLCWETNAVCQIDPDLNRVVAKVPLGVGIPIGGMAVGEGGVWISKQAQLPLGAVNALVVVDPRNQRVTKVFKTWFDGAFALGGGAVWVATPDQVARVDVASGRVVEKVLVPVGEYADLAAGEDALWLICDRSDTLWRINYAPPAP